ncbi:glycosyl transferase, family 2 [Candidatus Koribacter versatilis Ellin345]|uniref:Glycosyl transferase, family 2 n=1 Tax=Koribacter versatilis (strain Ellin345) TaxID=204669 RepID=Q1ITA5_KORVE|nr:glycosyltransferase family 2 protein [Candidatus Koribacter versatilis]ABF39895.1 glycosyl transferase, family 2 [Candidatus Koribacter versatilis Ellin345]
MSNPSISIVTPSLNQGPFLRECLKSVAKQGISVIEHIVMDGDSTDDSMETLKAFEAECRYPLRWQSKRDRGQSDAINKGFKEAKGEIIGWLNADDRYRPGAFSAVLDAFRKHPETDVLYGDYTWIDADGETVQQRREIGFSPFVLLYHRVLYIQTTAMFFHRRVLDAGYCLDESLHYAMDFEFFVRLSASRHRFLHVPVFLGDFRFQPKSKTTLHPERQLQEQTDIMQLYSPVFRHCPRGMFATGMTFGLRTAAAIRRYSEKAVRGYYLTQFRTAAPTD